MKREEHMSNTPADSVTNGHSETKTPIEPSVGNPSAIAEITRLTYDKFGQAMGALTNSLDTTIKLAEKGAIPFLLGSGVVLVFFCLVLKINLFKDHPLSSLNSWEFATVFIVGGFLMIAAAAMKVWVYTSEYALRKDELAMKSRILEASAGLAEKGMKASSEIALANIAIAKDQQKAGADAQSKAVDAVNKDRPVNGGATNI
jgi:hypothetical protein